MNDNIWFYGNGQYKIFTNKIKIMKALEDMGLKTSCTYHINKVKIGEDFRFGSDKLDKVKNLLS